MTIVTDFPAEERRLAALDRLALLDTPPAPEFDRVTRLAAHLLECPVALVSLVDRNRQWFKSRWGVDITETDRASAFCAHALASDTLLEIEDARADPRFADNPLVTGPPYIRFYAGMPIHGGGATLGTLCIIDTRPRRLSARERALCADLGAVVDDLIGRHERNRSLQVLNERLRETANALNEREAIFEQVGKIGGIGWWALDIASGDLRWSEQVYRLHERPPGSPIDVEKAVNEYVEADRPKVRAFLERAMERPDGYRFDAQIRPASGQLRDVRASGQVVELANGRSLLIGVIQDITNERRAMKSLRRSARRDSLTGLYNRTVFDETLRQRIKAHKDTDRGDLHILLLDLDGFKDINDLFGHLAGDELLRAIAVRLDRLLPEGTIAARWGGDEFALITAPGTDAQQTDALARDTIDAFSQPVPLADGPVYITATCGIASFEPGLDGEEMLRRADLALYHGKALGTGEVHRYRPIFADRSQQRQTAVRRLRDALAERRVYAAYQPIVDLDSGVVVGCEALLRFRDAAGDTVVAGEVSPALINPAISREVHTAMLDHFCRDARRLFARHASLRFISLNATEADLQSVSFADRLVDRLEAAGIAASSLVIEVTETMLMVNSNDTVKEALRRLHAAGVGIALDDFGTGYSSLTHLRDFPISKLKVDRSFVRDLPASRESRLIVQAIVTMARQMGIEVIAEGVENEAILPLLRQVNCHHAQGFLYGRATPIDELDWSHLQVAPLANDTAA